MTRAKAKDMASGKWPAVLERLGVPANVLDGKHHPCPGSGAGKDRFRFVDRGGSGSFFCECSEGNKGGLALLMCCRGWGYADAAREVEKVVGDAPASPTSERKDPRPRLNNLRTRAEPAGNAVRGYLAGRGLICPPSLQQVRDRYYTGKGQWSGEYEAMLARVVGPDGKPQSYHVTYLLDGRKAPVESPRKLMTPVDTINGAAVRLFPLASHLGIAEGIESAIAAHMLFGIPVWPVLNKNGIETFVPPPGVTRLTVFADNDASYVGQAAAFLCARRMVAKPIEIACDVQIPSEADTDWNDVLLARSGRAAA